MIALPNAPPDWPTTIKQAVGELLLRLSDANKDTVRNTAEADLPILGSSLGNLLFGLRVEDYNPGYGRLFGRFCRGSVDREQKTEKQDAWHWFDSLDR